MSDTDGRTGPGRAPSAADGRGDLALYVHVPFCIRRCHYCDFAVTRVREAPVDEWLACLALELEGRRARGELVGTPFLDTIFVGGGTPSLLGAAGVEELAALLARHFCWDPSRVEWTLEANPGSVDREDCRVWLRAGVNRLSLGVQSFGDHALRWLGRLHDAAEARAAVARARDAGFGNLNVDLIFGLPDDVGRDWGHDVETAAELGATHVSTYGLTAETGTPLGRMVELGRASLADEERYEREYLEAVDRLETAGFRVYEVSNHALPGLECRHNWHYWIGTDYYGLGPSAHSFVGGERSWNVRRWEAYRTATRAGEDPREGRERPDGDRSRLERAWLGLRTRRGLALDEVEDCPAARAVVTRWEFSGWARREGRRLRLTPAGWLRMDALVAQLDGAWDDVGAGATEGQRGGRR
jgi:oxygen-independent coproporphyrinogen-3 oxidase